MSEQTKQDAAIKTVGELKTKLAGVPDDCEVSVVDGQWRLTIPTPPYQKPDDMVCPPGLEAVERRAVTREDVGKTWLVWGSRSGWYYGLAEADDVGITFDILRHIPQQPDPEVRRLMERLSEFLQKVDGISYKPGYDSYRPGFGDLREQVKAYLDAHPATAEGEACGSMLTREQMARAVGMAQAAAMSKEDGIFAGGLMIRSNGCHVVGICRDGGVNKRSEMDTDGVADWIMANQPEP